MSKITHDVFMSRVIENNKHVRDGDIEILGKYTRSDVPIECRCNVHNKIWNAHPRNLYDGSGCRLCGNELRAEKQILSQDSIQSRIDELNKNIVIVGEYIHTFINTSFMCEKGHIWNTKPNSILNGEGCPYCSGKRVLLGFNDLATTRPDIAQLLKDQTDGYKYTKGSHKKVTFICPDCGFERDKAIKDVCQDGFICPRCGDGVSYPNKFGRAFLCQLPISNFKCEYHPDWAKSYFYDNYFEYDNKSYILEMDGAQHYMEAFNGKQTLKDRQIIDNVKTELAISHGINIIRICCLESDCEYIRNSMLSSDLNGIFDLSNINWTLCDECAQSNLVRKACDLYTYGIRKIKDIANILNLHNTTIRRYLKKGAKFGWCDYSAQTSIKESLSSMSKSVFWIDEDDNIKIEFASISLCANEISRMFNVYIYPKAVARACQTHKPYKGFNFRFANETIQN